MYDFYKKGNSSDSQKDENSYSDRTRTEEKQRPQPQAFPDKNKALYPLQKNMLFTMSNHDEVVRRVLSKNSPKK